MKLKTVTQRILVVETGYADPYTAVEFTRKNYKTTASTHTPEKVSAHKTTQS